MGSDEENTPDYSHPPSSQCSTLESNPDLPQIVQQLGSVAKKRRHCDTKEVCGENNLICILGGWIVLGQMESDVM